MRELARDFESAIKFVLGFCHEENSCSSIAVVGVRKPSVRRRVAPSSSPSSSPSPRLKSGSQPSGSHPRGRRASCVCLVRPFRPAPKPGNDPAQPPTRAEGRWTLHMAPVSGFTLRCVVAAPNIADSSEVCDFDREPEGSRPQPGRGSRQHCGGCVERSTPRRVRMPGDDSNSERRNPMEPN